MVLEERAMSQWEPEPVHGSASASKIRQPPGLREMMFALVTLGVLGTLVYAPHVLNGGFYLDDWANGAGALRPPGGPGVGNAFSYFEHLTLYRPVLVLYVPLTYFVFGTHMAYQLAWAAVLAMLVAVILYGILRTLGVPWVHAWFIAVLTLVYPWFDSTRLWETASQATLSIIFASGGLWLALVGLRRQSLRLHVCAAFLYLLSILTYEVTLPLIAAAGILYVLLAGWRVARVRWAIDLVAVLAGGLWVGLQTSRETMGLSADLRHLEEIVTSGGTMLGRSLIAFGEPRTDLALIFMLAVIVVGVVLYIRNRLDTAVTNKWSFGSWLVMVSGGLAVATLGWIMYIPANPYYTPTVYGFTNRVNALAGFGLLIAVYGVLGIVGEVIGKQWAKSGIIATTVTLLLGLLMGLIYTDVLERHIRIWNTAYRAEMAGIGQMRTQFPQLAPGTTIFVSNYPVYQTLGVPIFSSSWDVNGMVKLQYKDGTLSAYPVLPGLTLVCNAAGIGLKGQGAPSATAAYGSAILLDVSTGRHVEPHDENECDTEVGRYTPGTLYLSTTY